MLEGRLHHLLWLARLLYILRPRDSNYKLIGEAYVQGVMHEKPFQGGLLEDEQDLELLIHITLSIQVGRVPPLL
jgi:hypothetical protein